MIIIIQVFRGSRMVNWGADRERVQSSAKCHGMQEKRL